jgi:hypothetical protein
MREEQHNPRNRRSQKRYRGQHHQALVQVGLLAKRNSQADQNREEQKIYRVDPQQIMKPTNLMKPAFSRDGVEGQNLAEQHDDCGKRGHKYAQALV